MCELGHRFSLFEAQFLGTAEGVREHGEQSLGRVQFLLSPVHSSPDSQWEGLWAELSSSRDVVPTCFLYVWQDHYLGLTKSSPES